MHFQQTEFHGAAAELAAGCASGPAFIDQDQAEAMTLAQQRGTFELNYPAATPQPISRETLQPTWFRLGI